MNKIEYLLTCLQEEAAELTKVAAKAQRFGLESVNAGSGKTNAQLLNLEYTDLFAVLQLLGEEVFIDLGCIRDQDLDRAIKRKVKFMEVSREAGCLTSWTIQRITEETSTPFQVQVPGGPDTWTQAERDEVDRAIGEATAHGIQATVGVDNEEGGSTIYFFRGGQSTGRTGPSRLECSHDVDHMDWTDVVNGNHYRYCHVCNELLTPVNVLGLAPCNAENWKPADPRVKDVILHRAGLEA